MNNYEIVVLKDKFAVVEKSTGQRIMAEKFGLYDREIEARAYARHLNLGSGFDGWTPAFMQQKYFFDDSKKLVIEYK